MNELNDIALGDDALLVALVDGALGAKASEALRARLLADPALQARLDALRAGEQPFGPAFQALLDSAPAARLQAGLDTLLAARPAPLQRPASPWRRLALLAAALALLLGGVEIGRLLPGSASTPELAARPPTPQKDDWRNAVAEYAALYTADTFADSTPTSAADLARIGAKLDLTLTPERLMLADLRLRSAQILAYDDAPLAEIAYVDASGAPYLFCVFARAERELDLRGEKRGGFASASWAHGGRAYMVIGAGRPEQVAAMADTLKLRF